MINMPAANTLAAERRYRVLESNNPRASLLVRYTELPSIPDTPLSTPIPNATEAHTTCSCPALHCCSTSPRVAAGRAAWYAAAASPSPRSRRVTASTVDLHTQQRVVEYVEATTVPALSLAPLFTHMFAQHVGATAPAQTELPAFICEAKSRQQQPSHSLARGAKAKPHAPLEAVHNGNRPRPAPLSLLTTLLLLSLLSLRRRRSLEQLQEVTVACMISVVAETITIAIIQHRIPARTAPNCTSTPSTTCCSSSSSSSAR